MMNFRENLRFFLKFWDLSVPDEQIYPFTRQGSTHYIVLVPEAVAGRLMESLPEAEEARQAARGHPDPEAYRIAWQRMGEARYGRLRRSPSRSTRAAVSLNELPIPDIARGASLQERFAAWLEAHQISPLPNAVNVHTILFGAFALGETIRRTRIPAKRPNLGLDQNQHTGNRFHLILEGLKPVSPLPLHFILYRGLNPPPFQIDQPGLASAFGIRANNKAELLIAQSPGDEVRFYINKDALKKPLVIPETLRDILKEEKTLPLVLAAREALLSHQN